MAAKKKPTIAIEAFADEDDDELDDEDLEAIALAEAEKLAAEEEDDDEDDTEDEEPDDDDDSDEDEDPELAKDIENKFAPYVFLGDDETSWTLGGLFDDVDEGEVVYIYAVKKEEFYKLQPVEVGEIGQ